MEKSNGHHACPPSRRGHTWREGETPIDRVCTKCGAPGKVNGQGVVVAERGAR